MTAAPGPRRSVVFVAYYFPPDGGGGTQRVAKFCKYLPEFGWQPVVVTRPEPGTRGSWDPRDESLLGEIGERTVVLRAAAQPAPRRRWTRFDADPGWIAAATEAARRAVAEHRASAVVVSMSPFSLWRCGRELERSCGVPVVYDLRDPWALDGWRSYRSRLEWAADLRAMRETLAHAGGVIANTEESRRAIASLVPGLEERRLAVIPNGFDAADFEKAPGAAPGGDGVLRLLHSGTPHNYVLYPPRGPRGLLRRLLEFRPEPIRTSGRTFRHVLAALRELRRRGERSAAPLRFVHVGPADEATRRCVAESGVGDAVELAGYRSHDETIAQVLGADALFLPLHDLPPGRRSLIVPGKTYEYLASGRPILGALPPGDARDLVLRSDRGFAASPCDEPALAAALRDLLERLDAGAFRSRAAPAWLSGVERRELTRSLAGFLERVAGG